MSFGRFVWMLKEKALWMSRIDQLGDEWEMMPTVAEISAMAHAIGKKAHPKARFSKAYWKAIIQSVASSHLKHLKRLRESTFANCWTASSNESHPMWGLYCASKEGVAIQTTLSQLRQSIPWQDAWTPVGPHNTRAFVCAIKYVKFRPDAKAAPLEALTPRIVSS
jgi:hypothetical protein